MKTTLTKPKRLSNINAFLLLIFSLLAVASCNTTEPPPQIVDNELKYDWTIDTLRNPNGYGIVPWSMWGSSDSSVWIAGFNLAGQGELFHWDGIEWKRVTPDLGFNYELLSVFGFSENDIYAAGSRIIIDTVLHTESLVLHYDGITWRRENLPLGNGLKYIHGRNTNDMWACGIEGTLFHKTNNQWLKIPFDEKKYLGLLSEFPDLGPLFATPSGDVFIMNEYYNPRMFNDTAMFYFSKYSKGVWQDLDSSRLVNINGIPTGFTFGNKAMWGVDENEIYSAGNRGMFKYNVNKWTLTAWDSYLYRDLKGVSRDKIFIVGEHGTIRYFNGINWNGIRDFSSYIVDFIAVMPFENKIFIGAYQLGVGYVVRGTIQK